MKELRKIRHKRIRKKIKGTKEKPRLCVFRSSKHIYAQLIDDTQAKTLISVSTLSKDFIKEGLKPSTKQAAAKLGELVAEKAKKSGIEKVRFDKAGYRYHGKILELAEAARKGGLVF